ncbi:MAG: PA14 domain-containing protein [Caldimonas sp.]
MKFGTTTGMISALLLLAACGGGGGNADADVAYQAGPGPQGGAALYGDFRAGAKKLILHQREIIAVTPTALRDRLATMDVALDAFDGVFLRLPTVGDKIMKAEPVSLASIGADLQPVYGLRPAKMRFNFATVVVQRDLDAFDDWTPVLANVANLARVARDAGLVGIVVDNESIAGLRASYPYDVKVQSKTIEEYRTQTQLISKRIMQAIATEFPDAVVVVMRGPAGAEPKSSPALVNCESRDPAGIAVGSLCGESGAPLLGSFFAGFVEGKGARSLVVDGGTDYGLRTQEQFAGSADWRKTQLPAAATASAFIPDALKAAWPGSVSASFGLREIDGAHGNLLPNDPMLFAATVRAALTAADAMVWASFDLTDMTKVAAGDAWATAARRGKAAAASPGSPLSPQAMGSGTGLLAQYYSQIDESELAQTLVDPFIDNVWTGTGPTNTILSGQNDNFSVVWTGYLEAPVTGTYTIFGTTDDGMQIFLNGSLLLDVFFFQGPTEYGRTIDLVAGQRYPIKIRYFEGGGATEAHLAWQPPGGIKEVIPVARLYPMY